MNATRYDRGTKRYGLLLLFVCFTLLVSVACQSDEEPKVSLVKIGAVYPLSGNLAATGQDIQNGVELARDIVNDEYDLALPLARSAGLAGLDGATLQVVFADHAGDPDQGAAEAERLIELDGVVALIGSYNSSVTNSTSQAAEGAGIPFLNPESTSALLTTRGFRWFFRTTPDDSIFVENFFDFLDDVQRRQALTSPTVGIVYENSLFGTGVGQLEIQQARELGVTVVADVPYAADTTDVDQEVEQLVAADPTVVMQTSYAQDAILFTQAYKASDYRPQAILAMDAGFISPSFVEALGADANYILSREVWALDLAAARPLIGQVNELYRERYGANMTGNSARAFTGLIVLADAIDRAGSVEPEAIRQALLETDIPADQLIMPWDGIRFDPDTGQNTLARGIIVQIQEQDYYTVWPWNLAARELIWPMPDWSE